MDAGRRRLSSPAVAVAAILLFPLFFGSQPAAAYGGMTALQKHAAFFDRDNDGIVSFSETYDGLRALGLGAGLSSLSAAFINGALSGKTRPFEEIFTKHAMTVPDALTSDELDKMLQANRKPGDYSGWVGASAEWKMLYRLAKDKDGLLHKDVVRGVYDGSLFAKLVKQRRSEENQA
uniref:EF-hand domain-containing protein n=1 Tax=Leersia perrieri TaxID=77586 RepID=A0A0D9VKP6_9ORYZ